MASKKDNEEKKTEIQKTGPTAMAVHDYGEDAVGATDVAKGFEHQDKADMAIPFMKLCQPLTPVVAEGRAKMGDYMNTVTDEIFPANWSKETKIGTTGFYFVAGTTRHVFVEWVPRDAGGGYRGQHNVEDPIVLKAIKESQKFGLYKTPEGNRLVETFYAYGAICDEHSALSMAVVAFESTRIKAYKAWMTRLRGVLIEQGTRKVKPPLYAHLTKFSSREMRADKNIWAVPTTVSAHPDGIIASLLSPDDERFQMAKACMMLVDAGEAKVDYSKQRDAGDDSADSNAEPKEGDTSFNFSR